MVAEPLYAAGGQYGKYGCREYGRKSEVNSDTDTAERGMGDAAADEDQPPCNDISAYQPAKDTGQQTAQQGILEESVRQDAHAWSNLLSPVIRKTSSFNVSGRGTPRSCRLRTHPATSSSRIV